MVAHAAALERERAVGGAQQGGHAGAGPEATDVVGRPGRVGALHAVAGDELVDEPRVAGQHLVGAEAPPLEGGAAQVGDEHVGVVEQLEGEGLALAARARSTATLRFERLSISKTGLSGMTSPNSAW